MKHTSIWELDIRKSKPVVLDDLHPNGKAVARYTRKLKKSIFAAKKKKLFLPKFTMGFVK